MAVQDKTVSPADSAEAPYPKEGYAWYVVAILMIVYIFSFVDRQILSLLVEPIKADLNVTDEAMGYLYGMFFAVFYTLFGIPLGRMADSRSRRGLIAIGLFVWSLMSAACGVARNFVQLAIFRFGVGIGEATLSPSAYSLIADYFRPNRLALAISVYGAGIYIGSGMAFLVGGLVVQWAMEQGAVTLPVFGDVRPWQTVFFAIGLPGILFTLLMFSVREPIRRGLARRAGNGPASGIPFGEVVAYMRANKGTFFCHTVGFSFMAFVGYAGSAWIPTYFIRVHGWTQGEVGVRYGTAVILFGTAGIIFGGQLAEWLAEKGYTDSKMRAGLIGALFHLPFAIAFPLIADPWIAFVALIPAVFGVAIPFGVAPAAIQEMMPNQMRGQAAAVYLFVVNLIGLGLGPPTVGTLTTRVFKDPNMVHYSLVYANTVANALAIALLFYGMAHFRKSLSYRDAWHDSNGGA